MESNAVNAANASIDDQVLSTAPNELPVAGEGAPSGFNELLQLAVNFTNFWAPSAILNYQGVPEKGSKLFNASAPWFQLLECVTPTNCSNVSNISDYVTFADIDYGLANESQFAVNETASSPAGTLTSLLIEPDLKIYHPVLAIVLAIICLAVIFGNVLVMVAIRRERYLHTVTNYFVASLAAADAIVGCVVMPFSVVHEVMNKWWVFGQDWCDLWHSFDVLASTSSILHLCVISLDRYWAITDPMSYPVRMTPTRAKVLIAIVWACSALISFPAIIWWRAVSPSPAPAYQCLFTDDVGYLVFSSTISFYGPLTVMLFVYYRIYKAAIEQTRSVKLGSKQIQSGEGGENMVTLRIHRGGVMSPNTNSTVNKSKYSGDGSSDGEHDFGITADENGIDLKGVSVRNRNMKAWSISRKLAKLAKEKKAAKTLGIVMGVFILCWLPFFVTNILMGICAEACIADPDLVGSIVTWLGWLNSGMNPAIYACWSRDFRRAFKKILCSCCQKESNRRSRALQHARYSYSAETKPKVAQTQEQRAAKCHQSLDLTSFKAPTTSCNTIVVNEVLHL